MIKTKPWKDSWNFISRHFTVICLISLFYVVPIQLFYQFGMTLFAVFLSEKMYAISGMMLFLTSIIILQVPFILLVKQEIEVGKISIIHLVRTILDRSRLFVLVMVLFMILVSFGLVLYILPGLIIFVLLLLLPYSLLWERGDWKQRLKLSWNLGFQHLGKLIMLFTLFWAVLYLVGNGSFAIAQLYTAGEPVIILIPSFLSSLIFPLYSIYLTYRYLEWREA